MKDLKRFVDRNIAPLLLLCFCGIMAAFLSVRTNSFFSVKNAVNILEANSYRMLLAVGMMCIISSGAIDLPWDPCSPSALYAWRKRSRPSCRWGFA